jgi:hypothetical protein
MAERYRSRETKRKMARLNEQIENRFGFRLDLSSTDHLRLVQEHYRAKREFILTHYGLAEALRREDYAKAVLVSEAIGLFLREIAPRRTQPRTRPRKEQK